MTRTSSGNQKQAGKRAFVFGKKSNHATTNSKQVYLYFLHNNESAIQNARVFYLNANHSLELNECYIIGVAAIYLGGWSVSAMHDAGIGVDE